MGPSQQLPSTSRLITAYRLGLPCEAVLAATERFPALCQRPFRTCRLPYAERRIWVPLPRSSPNSTGLLRILSGSAPPHPRHRLLSGTVNDAAEFALCCGPHGCLPSCAGPTWRLPSGRRGLLHPSFPKERSPFPRVGYNYTASLGRYRDRTFTGWVAAVAGCDSTGK